ncbi:MAG: O-antigen ligase family protein [Desulfitobacterium sp.]
MRTKKNESYAQWYYLLPIIFVVTVLPLIVYLKVVPLTGASYDTWTGVTENYDFFSYYKGIWLIIAAAFGLFLVVVRAFLNDPHLIKKELKQFYLATGVYLLFIVGSTIFSDYRAVALSGYPDRYEGAYILIAYLVIFLITTALIQKDSHVQYLLGALMIGALAIGIIGLFQYIGHDPFKMDFVKSIILPQQYEHVASALEFQFDKYVIYATLFHYNYVGSYAAMLFPLCFTLFILTKRTSFKIAMGLMTLLMGAVWLGSNARSGIIGVALAFIVLLVVLNKIIKKHWKYFAASLLVVLVLFIGFNQISNGYIGTRVSSLFTDVKVLLGLEESTALGSESTPLKEVKINGNQGTIVTPTETLNFIFADETLSFTDVNGVPLETSYESSNGYITIHNPAYQDYTLSYGKMDNNFILNVVKGQIQLVFELNPERIALINNKGNEVSLEPVEAWGFEGNERIGSSRGYIWSRSLPLLKNSLIFGYGPDTFAIAFPQHDIIGKLYAYHGDMWQVVDKPHNLYLQIAINTGVLSLFAFLFLVGTYLFRSFRLYVSKPLDSFLSQAGVAVFVAIVGYLGAAFFNDSVVSVAPVFWVLLGLGVSVNHIISTRAGSI